MSKKSNDWIYIRDDLGHAWYFMTDKNGFGKICCVLADLDESVPDGENGYFCDSLEEGVKLLNEMGYITGHDEDSNVSDSELTYFSRVSK